MGRVKGNGGQYPADVIDKALIACIIEADNWTRARDRLVAAGVDPCPSADRISVWRKQYADRYQELSNDLAPKLAEKIASEAESLAVKYAEAERAALERLSAEIETIHPRELSGLVRNLATSKALQVDKISSPLRGRPTTINEVRNPQDAVRALAKALNMENVIEGSAEEVVPNQIEAPEGPDAA